MSVAITPLPKRKNPGKHCGKHRGKHRMAEALARICAVQRVGLSLPAAHSLHPKVR
jgi:hypothetical protein